MRVALAAFALLLVACPSATEDPSPGALVLTIPVDGTSNVPITQDVTSEWTAPVQGVVFAVTTEGANVLGTRNKVGDGSVWAWQPDGDFLPAAAYTVTLTWTGGTEAVVFSFETSPAGDDDDSGDDDSAL